MISAVTTNPPGNALCAVETPAAVFQTGRALSLRPATCLRCVGFTLQSCTLCGRTRSGRPSLRGRWTRSGTADTTSGCWRESWCILLTPVARAMTPPPRVYFSVRRQKPGVICQQASRELSKQPTAAGHLVHVVPTVMVIEAVHHSVMRAPKK